MDARLTEFNIEVTADKGACIDTSCPLAMAVYKLMLQYLSVFPAVFYIKVSQDALPAETHILNTLTDNLKQYGNVFFECHSSLPIECYNSFNLISDDSRSIYLFLSRTANLPLLLKGIANKIESITLPDNVPVPYRRANAMHNSAGVLWLNMGKVELPHSLNLVKIKLTGPLKLFMGTGAPITQN